MNIKKLVAVVLCLFCLAFAVSAQSDGWYYGKPIKFISFKGLDSVLATDIYPYTDKYLNKLFDDETYLDILNTVYELESFEDISAEVKAADAEGLSLNLEFTVVEYPSIKNITFKGNWKIRDSELKEAISFEKGKVYKERLLSVNERKIRDMYLEKGYTEVRVTSNVEETEKGIYVAFEINEGSPSFVTEIKFEGNRVFAAKTLKKQMAMREASLFQKAPFKESTIEIDRQNITAYYQTKGYLDVEVTDIRRDTTYNEDKKQNDLVITFVINEGDQYRYDGISFEGNHIFDTDRLSALVSIKQGDIFNKAKFEDSLQSIMNLYLENGYISNGFDYELIRGTDTNTISCIMRIEERERGHIESITLKGNTKTKDEVIMRELGIETGDIYSKTDIQNGLRNLYNTQYFSAIEPDFVQGSELNLIDMTLNVEEAQTASIEFGVSFSGISNVRELPVSAYINLSDTNFRGTGKTLSTQLTVSSSDQSISLGYSDAWFLNKPLTLSLNMYVSNAVKNCAQYMYLPSGINDKDYFMDYKELTLGASAALGKRFRPRFAMVTVTGGLSTDFIRTSYDDTLFTPVDNAVRSNLNSWGIKNGVWGSISFDDRDIYYDPSKGWFASQKISVYGLIPSIEKEFYMQSDTKLEGYATLCDIPLTETFNLKFVLSAYTGLSFMKELKEGTLGNQNKLYIDGMFNGRGWNSLFGVRGNALWSNIVELRMPLVPGVFALDYFFDAAAVKPSIEDMMTNLSVEDFYFSYGPGLRFSIPQFPLRILFANTFKVEDGEVQYRNRFAVTLSFNLPNR